jgi:hypothetical protein
MDMNRSMNGGAATTPIIYTSLNPRPRPLRVIRDKTPLAG